MSPLWLMWLGLAGAAETCEPLDEVGFRDLLLQLQAGIDRGDLTLSNEVIDEVHTRLPCFAFAPSPRQWSAYLVGESIVRFARGEAWEPTMSSALWLYPAVDRGVSSRHPLASYDPGERPLPGPPVSREGVFVDGLPAENLPADDGVHLVQRTDGRFWNSLWVGPDDPLPPGWVAAPVQPPPRITSFLAVDGGIGLAGVRQVPSFDTDWVQTIEPGDRRVVSVAADAQGAATFYSPFGVYGRGTVWLWGASPGLDAEVAAIWTWRGLLLGAGGGVTSIDELQGPEPGTPLAQALPEAQETHRVYMPRYALGTLHLRSGRKLRWHGGVTVGMGASLSHAVAELHVGQPIDPAVSSRWRVGLTAAFTSGVLTEQRRPDNRLEVGSSRVALTIGRVWGDY